MARFKQETANDDGWSDWIIPRMKGYRLGCCDCCLVHDMEFRVHKVTSGDHKATYRAKPLPQSKFKVEFRVRRNNRSTSALRRGSKNG